jgi:nucleotide-binding universal stress UspA family protein
MLGSSGKVGLYAVDICHKSQHILEHIKALRQAGTEEIVILHVTKESKYFYIIEEILRVNLAEFNRDIRKAALNEIKPIEDSFSQMGFKVKVIIVRRIVFEETLKTAEVEDVSLIVMGSRTSRIWKMLLGSTASPVTKKSRFPVYVVERQSYKSGADVELQLG